MIKFDEFTIPTKNDWIEILKKEIKGENPYEKLVKNYELEDISFNQFIHNSDINIFNEIPNNYPFKRAFNIDNSDFNIVHTIHIKNEKKDNIYLLEILMSGINTIHFVFNDDKSYDFKLLLQNINCKSITIIIQCKYDVIINSFLSSIDNIQDCKIFISSSSNHSIKENFSKNINIKTLNVDSYSLAECGSNTIQELCFSLCVGHNFLFDLLKKNENIEVANSKIFFTFGIGSSFFLEIAKFRAFRILWSKILYSYSKSININNTIIIAKTGFVNKSLKDPYTNLLRQSTEVLSAILGGVDYINNLAYDSLSTNSSSIFSERMARNIPLILKEESYINKVIDVAGGSYFVEFLTNELADKAWKLFQKYDGDNFFNSAFFNEVNKTRNKRIDFVKNKKTILIGINNYQNPQNSELKWNESFDKFFNLDRLILEKEINE